MLVLSRKKNQQLVIGTGPYAVTLTFSTITGNRVRIGIDAPDEVKIMRGELVPQSQWPLGSAKLNGGHDAA